MLGSKRSLKENILLFFKGMGMGTADLIPGVSGGTIAFITGIYEELLDAIKSCNHQALILLFQGKIKELWKHINGPFLIVLLSGLFLSLIAFSKLVHYLINNHPIQLWSFFFGLIIISAIMVFQHIKQRTIGVWATGIVGAAIAYTVTSASPSTTPDGAIFLFLSGMIAITAMILPGISGSFILLILGKYQYIVTAIKSFQILTLGIFGAGCVVGILTFSRVISWLLKKYHDITVATLAGFMFGSLNKMWPWKEVLTTRVNSKGITVPLTEKNILPETYMKLTGDPHVMQAIIFLILGFALIFVMEKVATHMNSSEK